MEIYCLIELMSVLAIIHFMKQEAKEQRPAISLITTGAELKRWYWLKDELIHYAKVVGVKNSGAKFDILERIAHVLDTSKTHWPGDQKAKPNSKFDWHQEPLTRETIITDSYKNSQNVRRFFSEQIGNNFKFNIAFMNWIKSNTGKTLGDAVTFYAEQLIEVSKPGYQTKIQPHNQFNQYIRDFLNANPDCKMDEVRRVWELKRSLPSKTGRHIYEDSDLDLT